MRASRPAVPVPDRGPEAGAAERGDKRNPTVVRLTPEQTRALKIHCANEETTVQSFLLEAIREKFARLGLTPFPD